jgi:hypothetical protein
MSDELILSSNSRSAISTLSVRRRTKSLARTLPWPGDHNQNLGNTPFCTSGIFAAEGRGPNGLEICSNKKLAKEYRPAIVAPRGNLLEGRCLKS